MSNTSILAYITGLALSPYAPFGGYSSDRRMPDRQKKKKKRPPKERNKSKSKKKSRKRNK